MQSLPYSLSALFQYDSLESLVFSMNEIAFQTSLWNNRIEVGLRIGRVCRIKAILGHGSRAGDCAEIDWSVKNQSNIGPKGG
jgi:hypothetical protein